MPAHTLRLQLKISSQHLAENIRSSPYSPDLAPSHFRMLLYLKTFLGGRRFHGDEVKEAVNKRFASQAA
jgi:hypothetical protein